MITGTGKDDVAAVDLVADRVEDLDRLGGVDRSRPGRIGRDRPNDLSPEHFLRQPGTVYEGLEACAERHTQAIGAIWSHETRAAIGGMVDREVAVAVIRDVKISLRPDGDVGLVDNTQTGSADGVFRILDRCDLEASSRLRLELELPAQASVARDGDHDVDTAVDLRVPRELTDRVYPREYDVQVSILRVGPAVGQLGERVDGQVGIDFEKDFLTEVHLGADRNRLVPGQAPVVAPGHKNAVVGRETIDPITGILDRIEYVGVGQWRLRPQERGRHEADEDVPLAVELHRWVGRPLGEPCRQRHACVLPGHAPASCEIATPIPA